MSKAIAVIDKPNNCEECIWCRTRYSLPLTTRSKGLYCQLIEPQNRVVENFAYEAEVHLQNCPLREVPQKITSWKGKSTNYQQGHRDGYNACIDEILKGSEGNG